MSLPTPPDWLQSIWNNDYIENNIDELWTLVRHITEHTSPLTTILEIGVAFGGTAHIWEKMVPPGGLFIGVDAALDTEARITGKIRCSNHTHARGDHTRFGTWQVAGRTGNVLRLQSDREMYIVIGDSDAPSTVATVRALLKNRSVDYLFHDGAHFGPVPVLDFQNYGPLVRVDGLLGLADIGYVGPLSGGPPAIDSGIQALFKFLPEPKQVISPSVCGIGLWTRPTVLPDVSPILRDEFPPYRVRPVIQPSGKPL